MISLAANLITWIIIISDSHEKGALCCGGLFNTALLLTKFRYPIRDSYDVYDWLDAPQSFVSIIEIYVLKK